MPLLSYYSSRKSAAASTTPATAPKPLAPEDLRARVRELSENDEGFFPDESRKEHEAALDELLASDGQLRRILVARKHDLPSSVDLIRQQMRFRARWNPRHIQPSQISTSLPAGAWRLCGHTKEGLVVANYRLALWQPDTSLTGAALEAAVDEYTRYICYAMELTLAAASTLTEHEKFAMVFDLSGFAVSMVASKSRRLMIRKLIYIAQAQYPERLAACYLVNAPYGFETAWRLIRPLLDPDTAKKVRFSGTADLLGAIDASVLPVAYGGEHEDYPPPSRSIDEEIRLLKGEGEGDEPVDP